jgi:hypothetical protein
MLTIISSSLDVCSACNGYYLYGYDTASQRMVMIACLGDGADLDPDADPTLIESWATPTDLAEAFDLMLAEGGKDVHADPAVCS